MSDRVQQLNIASLITMRLAVAATSITAGGTGDATAITPVVFDRAALGMPMSAEFMIAFKAVLTATKKLSIGTVKVQHSDASGSGFTDFVTFTDPGAVATGGAGGSTEIGQVANLAVDLSGAKNYIQLLFTPDLDASGTDTAILSASVAFAGADRLAAVA